MDNTKTPEVLSVIPLPTSQERKRREIMLARVMLVAIDIVLAGESLGLETARVGSVSGAVRLGPGRDVPPIFWLS